MAAGLATACGSTSAAPTHTPVAHGRPLSISRFGLIAPHTGWAVAGGRLFWTRNDGRIWTNITPPGAGLAGDGIAFADAEHGVIVRSLNFAVTIRRTIDGGGRWQTTALRVDVQTGGEATISFANPRDGWIDVPVVSGSSWPTGLLLQTRDGGRVWRDVTPRGAAPGRPFSGRATRFPFPSGQIEFTSPTVGFLVNDQHNWLYRSGDGGRAWSRAAFPVPAAQRGATPEANAPPTTIPGGSMVLPATLVGAIDSPVVQVFYVSRDGGRRWALTPIRRSLGAVGDAFIPAWITPGAWYVSPRGTALLVYPAADPEHPGPPHTLTVPPADGGFGIRQVEFASAVDAWVLEVSETCNGGCHSTVRMETTTDGGARWSRSLAPAYGPV